MISLEIDQEIASADERLSEKVLEVVEARINDKLSEVAGGLVAISYVTDNEIQRLNRMYRDKDAVTDVLSFSYLDDEKAHGSIGDVVISLEQAKRQAQEDLELELVDLIVHGVLHVLGHDHEKPEESKEMFTLQDTIVANIL